MALLAVINDTVRHACAQAMFFVLVGLAVVFIILAGLTWGTEREGGIMQVRLFGMIEQPVEGIEDAAIVARAVYVGLWLILGTLLFAFSASFMVSRRLAPGIVEMYVSMPVSRLTVLAGMSIGIFLTFFAPCVLAVMGVWLVVGLKTGVFAKTFLYPLLFDGLAGLTITAMAVALSTITRSAMLSAMYLTLVWVSMFFLMPIAEKQWNYEGEMVALSHFEYGEMNKQNYEEQRGRVPALIKTSEFTMRYLCPPVIDLGRIAAALESPTGGVLTWRPVYVSLAQTLVGFALAGIWFARKDY